jgi:putative component of membrane protein insertase Oxa1/YidC/SpoIIIJ protein YidD
MNMKSQCGNLLLIFSLCFSGLVYAKAQERVDGTVLNTATTQTQRINAVADYIDMYQHFISKHKNGICPMYPSCSNYGLMAFCEQPFYKAISLTADRLTRCSHDAQYYGITYAYGRRSILDYPYYKETPEKIEYQDDLPLYAPQLYGDATVDSVSFFINYLISNRNYEVALLEIERSLYNNRQDNIALCEQKMLCYEALGLEEKGIFEYETVFSEQVKKDDRITFKTALLYDKIKNDVDAERLLCQICNTTTKPVAQYKAYTFRGIIAAQQMDFTQARELFMHAAMYGDDKHLCEKNLEILNLMQKQKYKSASVARWLSLIPGGGYLYTGHKGSALTSFVINSLLGYATYTSFKSKNYGIGVLCGFLSLSFYIGNMSGAGRSAIRYNEQIISKRVKNLKELNPILFY